MDIKRIAVVGGGISGLAAAHRLRQILPDAETHVIESSHRFGGVIETLHENGFLVEKGADNFATLVPDALDLSRQCGLESDLIPPEQNGRQAFVLHRGRLKPIPAGFSLMQPTRIWSILTTPTLSWPGKMRLAGEFFVKARKSNEDESLESFVVRRLGREAFENLVEPIVSGIFTADPTTLSMQATMPQFLEMERRCGGLIRGHLAARKADAKAAARRASGARYEQFRAPKSGMNDWIDGIVSALPTHRMHLNCQLESLAKLPNNRWQLTVRSCEATDEREFDAIILATPAAATSYLLEKIQPVTSQLLARIQYASSAVVALVLKRSEIDGRLDGFGAIVPSKEGRQTLAISYTSNKYPGRTSKDEILLRVFMGGALAPNLVDREDDELIQVACQEIRELLYWRGKDPVWKRVIRWRKAMPQYVVGHCQLVEQIEAGINTHRTLRIAGAAYWGVGIPQCVRSGYRAADAIRQLIND